LAKESALVSSPQVIEDFMFIELAYNQNVAARIPSAKQPGT
jgi:hypothetical protein